MVTKENAALAPAWHSLKIGNVLPKDEKVENFSTFCGSNDTAKGAECAKCPLGESRKDIVKEGTELGEKFAPSLCIHAKVEEDKKNSETVSPFSKDAKA